MQKNETKSYTRTIEVTVTHTTDGEIQLNMRGRDTNSGLERDVFEELACGHVSGDNLSDIWVQTAYANGFEPRFEREPRTWRDSAVLDALAAKENEQAPPETQLMKDWKGTE